jgi:hypothetical protein
MKNLKLTLMIVPLFVICGCYWEASESITGNGNAVTQERDIQGFHGISVSTGIDVYITQSDEERVRAETDENLQDVVKTEVKDGILKIYATKNIHGAASKKVYVDYINLSKIKVSSAGDVKGENTLNTDELEIGLSSSGDLRLDVNAQKIYVNISSSGNGNLSGKTDYLKANLSSSGDLNAFDLEAKVGDISVSSAGDAKVFITEEASFSSSSSGDIYYKGDPKINYMRTSSSGSIIKK